MKKTLVLAGLLVTTVFLVILFSLNYILIDFGLLLGFLSQLSYVVTYISLVVCLCTVIITFLWYPKARKKFSSPIKHSSLSIMQLLLVTTLLIIAVQISLLILYPDFLFQISFYLFFISLLMFIIRNSVTIGGAYLHKRREKRDSGSDLTERLPLVTVIVPAYNEEKAIGKTAETLLRLSYPNKEIIIVDDGSTDRTLEVARSYAKGDLVKVVKKPNGGKWDALNSGIKESKGKFIVCIDADTLLDQNAIQRLIKHFNDPKIAAVAGNVKVGNRSSILTKLQALEYIVGINLHRRTEASFQKVTVVPGPIGAFRASILKEIGLFEGDTFAEDADITIRILKAGYKTVFEPRAFGYTEAPKS
ncbi:MAG: glycosyltransferase family 2 protein, partial [Promethearchaeota archaeon]